MQTSLEFHAQADAFRSRAASIEEAEPSRALLMHLSQTWESLADAWDRLPPPLADTLAFDG